MRTITLVCVLLLAACGSPSEPSDPDTSDPSQELARNQRQFQATVGDDYRVTIQNNCFCPLEVMQPVRLTVRDGDIREVTRLSDGAALPPSDWRAYRTVEQVFAEIDAGLNRGARRVEVEYDGRYGYPQDVLIDYLMAADNFVGFKLRDLDTLRAEAVLISVSRHLAVRGLRL